jgi:MATE family multidrug resistance protein
MILSQYRRFKQHDYSLTLLWQDRYTHLLVALADNIMVGKLGTRATRILKETHLFCALSVGMGFSFAITPLVAERLMVETSW